MHQSIEIVISNGLLTVTPFPEYLKKPLSFYELVTVMKPFEYRDKSGKLCSGERKDGYENKLRPLFTEIESTGGAVTHRGLFRRIHNLILENGDTPKISRKCTLPSFVFSREVVEGLLEEQQRVLLNVLSEIGTGQVGWEKNSFLVQPHPGSGGALVEATMSTGKTFIIAALIKCFPHVNVLVVTKKVSVINRLVSGLSEIIKTEPIGVFFGLKKQPQRVTVCSEALLSSFDTNQIGLIIYDEVHNSSGEVVSSILLQFDRSVKIGLSATLSNHKKKKFIESIFGPIVDTIDDEEADQKNLVAPVKVYALHIDKGPDISGHVETGLERWGITRNSHRNKLIAQIVERVPEHMQLIIFVRTIDHIEELMSKLPPGFSVYHGQLSGPERSRVEAGIISGELKRIVANDALSEGVNTTKLRVMIEAGWSINDETVSQRAGRNRRKDDGKKMGIIITMLDDWEIKGDVEGLSKTNPLKQRAASRLRVYEKRKWPVLKIKKIDEIDFSEIED